MPRVRYRAKNFFLTYSQVNDDTSSAFLSRASAHFDHVADAVRTPVLYRLAREPHQDGGTHFHVFVGFDKRTEISPLSILDFGGSHPNVESVPRHPEKCWDYAGKGGDIIYECGSRPGNSGTSCNGRDSIFESALSAETKDDFYSTLRSGAPRDFVLYSRAITEYAERAYAPVKPEYVSPSFETYAPDGVLSWYEQSGIGGSDGFGGRRKSLILWGPTRTGKTVWARSLGRYVTLTSFATKIHHLVPVFRGRLQRPTRTALQPGKVVNVWFHHCFHNHANSCGD